MVDKTSPIPLYCQLKAMLEREINEGRLEPGARMPSELELAAHYQVSRTTARQAIQKLSEAGRVTRIQGKGTFVREVAPPPETSAEVRRSSRRLGASADGAPSVARPCPAVRLVTLRDGDDICFDRVHQTLVRGVEHEAREVGCDVILSSCRKGRDDLNALLDRHAETGLILYGEFGGAMLGEITRRGVPAVVVDDPEAGGFVDGVRLDHHQEAAMAAEHLLRLGHEVVAYVGGSRMQRNGEVAEWTVSRERREGFVETMRNFGFSVPEEHVLVEFGTQRHAFRAARRLFDRILKPSAVIAFSPAIALGIEAAASECGIRVPEELSLLTFSDTEQVFYRGDRTFSAVWSNAFEAGRLAMRLLNARLSSAARPPQTVNVPFELWTGDSTAPLRVATPAARRMRLSH